MFLLGILFGPWVDPLDLLLVSGLLLPPGPLKYEPGGGDGATGYRQPGPFRYQLFGSVTAWEQRHRC